MISNVNPAAASELTIPFITGDGIGRDITPVMRKVVDSAVKIAYSNDRRIDWLELHAGESAMTATESGNPLPQETMDKLREHPVSIKGPLATPVGGGFRSLNVTLRQTLDLYVCMRPVRYFEGTPSPLKNPENTNMTVFRENSEDIYAGIEWPAGSAEAGKLIRFLTEELQVTSIPFPETSGLGIKPISRDASRRLIRKAIQYALDRNLPYVTLVHKGNIMKFTEGAFLRWGYELAREEFGAVPLETGAGDTHPCWLAIPAPSCPSGRLVIKDSIADAFLQEILLRPREHSVIATTNLNGDYISDALAAQVGGIGIAPGVNMSDHVALFEATHGTAPSIAGKNLANPCSILLSAALMLEHIGWSEAGRLVVEGVGAAIGAGEVTSDLATADPSKALSTSAFGDAVISRMDSSSR